MGRALRIIGIISIVVGVFSLVAGGVTYYIVHRELADEHITVSEDAKHMAGDDVTGPLTAYAQAMAIKEHAIKIGGGKTYAELPQDDPKRNQVMTADFLQASLFTSVVAFGMAILIMGLGLMFVLFGYAFVRIGGAVIEDELVPPPSSPVEPEAPPVAVA